MAKARSKARGKAKGKATGKARGKARARAKREAIGRTSTQLEPKVAGLLCYVLGWVTGVVFLILEKKNKFVRFHAIQSIVVFGAFTVVWIVLGIINGGTLYWRVHALWVLFSVIIWLLAAFAFILWIILMLKAYAGEKFKLPVSGDIAEKASR